MSKGVFKKHPRDLAVPQSGLRYAPVEHGYLFYSPSGPLHLGKSFAPCVKRVEEMVRSSYFDFSDREIHESGS